MHPAYHARPPRLRPRRLEPMTDRPRLAWLFDVDGTLLLTDGAGRDAISCALLERLGVVDDLKSVPFAGRTDPLILGDVLRRHGLALAPADEPGFWEAVVRAMERELTPGRGRVLPGVPEALEAVAAEPGWLVGLLTGNFSRMAHLKLERLGLGGRFAFGTFGEEGPDRDTIARLAVGRVAERWGLPPGRCVVVGDTEHDVACARAAGAHAVAVATGWRDRAALEASGPDLLLDDLSDRTALVEWGRRIGS